jgi:hypothetical protein
MCRKKFKKKVINKVVNNNHNKVVNNKYNKVVNNKYNKVVNNKYNKIINNKYNNYNKIIGIKNKKTMINFLI